MSEATFRAKATAIMRALMAELDITAEDAAAILGNIGQETGGFSLLYEANKPRADQGFGWAQWTRDRRDQFEKWAKGNGFDPHSDEANLGFLVHELTNTWEKRALPALRQTDGLEAKTLSFMRLYERPGTPHADRRVAWARIALDAFQGPSSAPQQEEATMVPAEWMPPADMERIIVHWTAGGHRANATDRKSYHLLIEGDGKLIRGVHPITANENPTPGAYAAHTLNCNTRSIGVSMCAMAGAQERPFKPGTAPLTKAQWDAMVRAVADLCRRYSIPVTPKTVLTHAEVQTNLGIQQRGKWDIAILPFDTSFDTAKECGDRLRTEVASALSAPEPVQTPSVPEPAPAPPAAPANRGDKGIGILAAIGLVLAGAYQFFIDHILLIAGGLFGLAAVGIIIFRLIKGRWPWTGNRSQAPLLPSPQSSVPSLELDSALLALSSAASPDAPLPEPSASKPRRKRSAKPSRATPKPSVSSKSSKRPAARKSVPKRRSKSKG